MKFLERENDQTKFLDKESHESENYKKYINFRDRENDENKFLKRESNERKF